MQQFVLCVMMASLALAAPPLVARDPYTSMQADLEPVWEQNMLGIVASAVNDVPANMEGSGELVQVSGESAPSNGVPQPPLPRLGDHVSNLQAVLQRIEAESVNANAVQDSLSSSYQAKRADLQSLLAVPEQALLARKQQRQMCEKEILGLGVLSETVVKAVDRDVEVNTMRQEQANHYTQTTEADKALAQKNKATLTKVTELLKNEILLEAKENKALHFDATRQQQPEDQLRHAADLVANLASLIDSKLERQGDALQGIVSALSCPKCVTTSNDLAIEAGKVKEDHSETKSKCEQMAELHRPIDEADRETVLTLKKELSGLDAAERMHEAAEEALKIQRQQSEQVGKKMVGYFQDAAHP